MPVMSASISQMFADHLNAQGPLESWRMPSWDEREGYYEDGTVLSAEDVPIYRPPYPFPTAVLGLDEEQWVRIALCASAPYYRLRHVPINAVRPQQRVKPHEVAWIEKFVDLIRRGSEPPPVLCDLASGLMMNGSVRTHALRALGRTTVHAWVADRDYKPQREDER
jgi:hypothetical protein